MALRNISLAMTTRGGADLIGRRSEVLVLDAARRGEAVDRASLASRTELTPQAVSNVLTRLADAGLVETAGTRSSGVGKPATVYRMRDAARQAVGVHVTRRGVRLAQVDLRGNVGERLWFDLEPDFGPEALIERVREGVGQLGETIAGEGGTLVGVGIGMIGPLDHRRGIVRDAYSPKGWHDVPLCDLAHEALGMPVVLDKDVTAAAAGQAWALGTDAADTALILIEAGVGAGLWLRDATFRGAHTNAGEFGHTVVDINGPRCVCGRDGCVEAVHDAAIAARRHRGSGERDRGRRAEPGRDARRRSTSSSPAPTSPATSGPTSTRSPRRSSATAPHPPGARSPSPRRLTVRTASPPGPAPRSSSASSSTSGRGRDGRCRTSSAFFLSFRPNILRSIDRRRQPTLERGSCRTQPVLSGSNGKVGSHCWRSTTPTLVHFPLAPSN